MWLQLSRSGRPPISSVCATEPEEFIRQNADPIWLHQHGYWEILHEHAMEEQETLAQTPTPGTRKSRDLDNLEDIPF